jgi:cell division protein FtsB
MSDAAPARRTTLTGRAAILALVLAVLLVALALPVRSYLAQRSELAELTARKAAAADSIAQLQQQRTRWGDPAYVKAQARERLHYVLPGETGYVVLRPTVQPPPRQVAPEGESSEPATPWFTALWQSAQAADSGR